jgi:5-hydroxyisourate hydrolase-like protein (transthyretin family)
MNTAVTDDEGNWKFKEMPKGEYSIQVEPSNRANATGEDEYAANSNVLRRPMPSAPKFARKFQDVKIDDKDVADVIVELGYGALISGTVSTANSRIMPTTFSIDAVREDGESAASDTIYSYPDRESGENGRKTASDFKLENAASGKINLKFYSNDGDYYVKSAQSGMTDLLTTPLELKDGDSIINIKIELADDAGTLKGRVLDEENHPVSGVRLLLVPTDAAKRRASNLFKNTRSDLEGRFEIKLPPGEYAILLSKAGLEELSRDDFNKWLDEAMRSPDKVSIEPNGNSTVTVKKPGK